ncbi:MAG TPA: hypothetical protein VGD81_02245 [Opitutaceae bacterium]
MPFVWFWTFWHWSKEAHRCGALLHGPLDSLATSWDEWLHHEASEDDLRAIAETGRTELSQRQFIAWLLRHWAREADLSGNRSVARFVLGQLAQLPPFEGWTALHRFRGGYGAPGISVIVLEEGSRGAASDVRAIETVVLPSERDRAHRVVTEGFHANASDLSVPVDAAASMLGGKGLLVFLTAWLVRGRRQYPPWLRLGLLLGWLAVLGLLVTLLVGPEPGERLFAYGATLVTLWSGLLLVSIGAFAVESVRAVRAGRKWRSLLEHSQVHHRMPSGLTVDGGSAGLGLCLNTMLGVYRAHPGIARSSWLWRQFFRQLGRDPQRWAATGVVTADAQVKRVVVTPKVRAALKHPETEYLLAPRQREATRRNIERMSEALEQAGPIACPVATTGRRGARSFPAGARRLRGYRCRHVATAMIHAGRLASSWQLAGHLCALLVSVGVAAAMPDLAAIVRPPSAPAALASSSPSSELLWVSLDTDRPQYFRVVLESHFWTNRRVDVVKHGGPWGASRAEIRLIRVGATVSRDPRNGVVWIERRNRLLWREYEPGERVGRYPLHYLLDLRRD